MPMNGNLRYGVQKISSGAMEAVFASIEHAFLWKDCDIEPANMQVWDLVANQVAIRPVAVTRVRRKPRSFYGIRIAHGMAQSK